MKAVTPDRFFPRYRGTQWIRAKLPDQGRYWLESTPSDRQDRVAGDTDCRPLELPSHWTWPKRPIYFFSDLHADADAFLASLVASGGIEKTGIADDAFQLSKAGRRACFIIGGDCFDKGPSNLRLLRVIRRLLKRRARVRLLVGNHDIRVLLGMRSVGQEQDLLSEHFFVRMGAKSIPFLKEIYDSYLDGQSALRGIPGADACRRLLYPSSSWFKAFPRAACWLMPEKGMVRELERIHAKMEHFEEDCERLGLSLRMAYAAALQWQRLFLHPRGEFYWFFEHMQLAYRVGSFLFVHAGLDDRIARLIHNRGIKMLNQHYRQQVRDEGFDFYYGPLANTIRTKYRDVDMPLTPQGVHWVKRTGIQAIVHGHKNLLQGQRIVFREGLVNFECDASLDCHTRSREGLAHPGAAVTLFHPRGLVLGISTDHPYIKVFDPLSQELEA